MDDYKVVIFLSLMCSWIAELRLHLRNSNFLRRQGALSFGGKVYFLYYSVAILCVLMPLIEGLFLKSFFIISYNSMLVIIGMMFLVQLIRWYAIDSINNVWTFNGYSHKNLRKWAAGPYRYCEHPELLSRFLEAICLFFLFGGGSASLVVLIALTPATLAVMSVESSVEFSNLRDAGFFNQK